jgi:hypothetical protein
MMGAGSQVAQAFDPQWWATESTGNQDTHFCISNDFWDWNDNAKDQIRDAKERWETHTGLNIVLDSTVNDCHDDGVRIEIIFVTCLGDFSGDFLGRTWPLAGGGTAQIQIPKWFDCGQNDLVPWFWNDAQTIQGHQWDFESVMIHGIGHAIGIKHPEDSRTVGQIPWYPFKSWDGNLPKMRSQSENDGQIRRVLQQDDLSAGFWTKAYQWLAKPNELTF